MLYDDHERRLATGALQATLATNSVRVQPFEHIVADFDLGTRLVGGTVLDIGPGQCDFLDMARRAGARTCGVDHCASMCALGRHRGHDMVQAELTAGWPHGLPRADGIFCRGSIDLHWFEDDLPALRRFLHDLGAAIRDASWAWIVPWNKPRGRDPNAERALAQYLRSWLAETGLDVWQPDPAARRRYGIGYLIPTVEIWQKGLPRPAAG